MLQLKWMPARLKSVDTLKMSRSTLIVTSKMLVERATLSPMSAWTPTHSVSVNYVRVLMSPLFKSDTPPMVASAMFLPNTSLSVVMVLKNSDSLLLTSLTSTTIKSFLMTKSSKRLNSRSGSVTTMQLSENTDGNWPSSPTEIKLKSSSSTSISKKLKVVNPVKNVSSLLIWTLSARSTPMLHTPLSRLPWNTWLVTSSTPRSPSLIPPIPNNCNSKSYTSRTELARSSTSLLSLLVHGIMVVWNSPFLWLNPPNKQSSKLTWRLSLLMLDSWPILKKPLFNKNSLLKLVKTPPTMLLTTTLNQIMLWFSYSV